SFFESHTLKLLCRQHDLWIINNAPQDLFRLTVIDDLLIRRENQIPVGFRITPSIRVGIHLHPSLAYSDHYIFVFTKCLHTKARPKYPGSHATGMYEERSERIPSHLEIRFTLKMHFPGTDSKFCRDVQAASRFEGNMGSVLQHKQLRIGSIICQYPNLFGS